MTTKLSGQATATLAKIDALIDYFENFQEEGSVQLDNVTFIFDVKKFVASHVSFLKNIPNFNVLKPYAIRLHKLRLYYEQKRKS